MTQKKAVKKSAAKKKAAKKITRIEKLEAVVAELALKLRGVESALNELKKSCESCCKPATPTWPQSSPPSPWYPIWHNVWQAVDYATAIQNKEKADKDKYNKHPGDQT